MNRFVSFDPRAAQSAHKRIAQDAEFAAALDESSALISAAVRALARSPRLHAVEIFCAAAFGTALSILGIYYGVL